MGTPFLRWVGGKRKLAVPITTLLGVAPGFAGTYHEPFLGSGALAFHLLGLDPRLCCQLSDTCRPLMAAWVQVQDDVAALEDRLTKMQAAYRSDPFNTYVAIRAGKPMSQLGRAAWMVFLNRTGFNGMYRVNKSGGFNVPWGKNPDVDVVGADRLRAAAGLLRGDVSLHQRDYAMSMPKAVAGDVVYCDSPYAPAARASAGFTAYTPGGFTYEDQVGLAHCAKRLIDRGARVVLSNHDTAVVRDLYPCADGWTIDRIGEARSINSDGAGRGKVPALLIHGGPMPLCGG